MATNHQPSLTTLKRVGRKSESFFTGYKTIQIKTRIGVGGMLPKNRKKVVVHFCKNGHTHSEFFKMKLWELGLEAAIVLKSA